MRACLYVRLSRDSGSSSLDRQRAACEALCARRGWTVIGVYVDNDASAYRAASHRPEFERLLEDIAASSLDMVVVFKIDRLVRRPADFERLWDIAERRATNIASVTEPIDSSTPHGVAFIRILVALAGLESATTGLRVAALRREEAATGRAGSTKAYGLTADWRRLVPDEAALIREAARRVLHGERVAEIARDWRARSLPGPKGNPWSDSALNRILHNPRIAGDRAYRGEIVAVDCYPAVLDRPTFDQLQTELGQPGRQGAPKRHAARLASGSIFCGRCGARLMQSTRSGRRFYSCANRPTGCGRLHVNADYTDAWLREALCQQIRSAPALPCPPDGPDDRRERLAELAADYYARRLLSREEFLAARSAIDTGGAPPSRALVDVAARIVASANPPAALAATASRLNDHCSSCTSSASSSTRRRGAACSTPAG